MRQITTTIQHDHQYPKPAMSFNPTSLVSWVRQKIQAGHVVHTCAFDLEAGKSAKAPFAL